MEEILVQNDYKPGEKANLFHGSDARVIVLVGGLGSGKSRSAIEECINSGLQWPGMAMAVYRKTMPSLRDSTLHEYKSHVPPEVGRYREKAEQHLFYNKSFVNFRGLDDPQKAKSSEYGMIIMEEADEFTFEDFQFLHGRVRKKGDWPLRTILVLNPCDEQHWIYKQFVTNKAEWESAGGLLVLQFSTYDNIENLPAGYIEQQSAGKTPEEIDRWIWGEWGSIVKGEPVYGKKITDPRLHLRKFTGQPTTLLRGWDFGFNHPACSFRLVDEFRRQNIAYEMLGEKEDLDVFALRVIAETERRFGTALSISDYGDPRGHDKTAAGGDTCFETLAGLGVHAIGERKIRDYVEPGIKQVRSQLSTLINGVPELTLDPDNVPILKAAYLTGKYVRGEDGRPHKDGYYEHLCDADRYIPHHHKYSNAVKDAINKKKVQESFRHGNKFTGYGRKFR